MGEEPENPNPIVAMAMRIRARKDLEGAIDSATPVAPPPGGQDAAAALDAFGQALAIGAKRLNSILGRDGVRYVRLENPLRLRLRFRDKRVSLDLDAAQQLVRVGGEGLEGEYQFDSGADVPALINLSKLSTEAGYGDALTPATLLKMIASDAKLPRPKHLDEPGPMRF
jgi:hypothetical protein